MVDVLAYRRWAPKIWRYRNREALEAIIIRLGVGTYTLFLFNKTAVAPWAAGGDGSILTPELFQHDAWIRSIQIAIGCLLIFRSTCAMGGAGLLILYVAGIVRYGLFHMTDYTYFVCLAGYLILSDSYFDTNANLRRWRVPLITAGLSFSLMWTAIEKFLYPLWTGIVLSSHTNLTMGFPIPFVTVMAGFVEFSLAFYLLAGRSLLRLDTAVLMLVFLSAIPEFGVLDSVGHIPIVAMLLVIFIHGPGRLQQLAQPSHGGYARAAVPAGTLCVASFAVMMTLYYGLQRFASWP